MLFSSILYIATAVLFFLIVTRSVLRWTAFWQKNDYSIKNIVVNLWDWYRKNLPQFFLTILFFLTIVSYGFIIFHDDWTTWYQVVVVSLFFITAALFIREIKTQKFEKPVFTFKSLTIIFLVLFSISLLSSIPLLDTYMWFVLLCVVTPFFVAIFVGLFSFPTEVYTDIQLQKAKNKIATFNDLHTIVVFGNYADGLPAEMLFNVLKKEFSVVKTPKGNTNTLRVAQTFLKNLTINNQICIIEINTYKKDTIEKIENIIKPDTIIFTGFYPSSKIPVTKKILKAQERLLKKITKNGIYLMQRDIYKPKLVDYKNKIHLFKFFKENTKENSYISAHIAGKKDRLTRLVVKIGKKSHTYNLPFKNEEAIESLLPAIYIARTFGLSQRDLQESISSMKRFTILQRSGRK